MHRLRTLLSRSRSPSPGLRQQQERSCRSKPKENPPGAIGPAGDTGSSSNWGWGSPAAFAGLRHLDPACGNRTPPMARRREEAELPFPSDADQVVDDRADVLLVDGSLVGGAHLVHLSLPFGPG